MTVSPTSGWLDFLALLAGRAPARTRTSLCSDIAPFPRAQLRCSASCDGARKAHFDTAIHGLPDRGLRFWAWQPSLHARAVHHLHQHAHVLRVHLRRDAVAEVEDMAGMRAEVVEHAAGLAADHLGGGEQRRRIQVALQRDTIADT